MTKLRDDSFHEDLQDNSSVVDVDEIFSPFATALELQLTESEISLRNELKLFKQTKKLLNDINQEVSAHRIKPEAVQKQIKSTERAKEEAMKLLKSGAISFDTGGDRHVFKRKIKELDGNELEEVVEQQKHRRSNLYTNFVAGEKIFGSHNPSPLKQSLDVSNESRHSTYTEDTDRARGNLPLYHPSGGTPRDSHHDRLHGGSIVYISFNGINESAVGEIFEPYGPIVNIRVDERKGYGFVTLKSPEIAEKALQLDRTTYGSHRLRVNYAHRQHHNEHERQAYPDHRSRNSPGKASYHHIEARLSSVASPDAATDKPSTSSTVSESPGAPSNRHLVNYNDMD